MNKLSDENVYPLVEFDNFAKKIDERGKNNWYKWRVFAKENGILDKIDRIEYLLHPTFPDRKRVIKDRGNNFALESEGWGQFYIFITIWFKDGRKQEQRYWLSFKKEWPPDFGG